jgi:hypothetical protein
MYHLSCCPARMPDSNAGQGKSTFSGSIASLLSSSNERTTFLTGIYRAAELEEAECREDGVERLEQLTKSQEVLISRLVSSLISCGRLPSGLKVWSGCIMDTLLTVQWFQKAHRLYLDDQQSHCNECPQYDKRGFGISVSFMRQV